MRLVVGALKAAVLVAGLAVGTMAAVSVVAGAPTRIELSSSAVRHPLDPSGGYLVITARVVDHVSAPVVRGRIRFVVNGDAVGTPVAVDATGRANIRMSLGAVVATTYVIEARYEDDLYEPSRAVITNAASVSASEQR